MITWTRQTPTGSAPVGRTEGLLAFDPVTESLVLYAGRSGTSTLGDVWRFDVASGGWESLELAHYGGSSPGSRHSFAHAQRDTTVYLYGGKDPSGSLLGDLYELDLPTPTVRTIDQDLSTASPGARASAGLTIEVDGQSVWCAGLR